MKKKPQRGEHQWKVATSQRTCQPVTGHYVTVVTGTGMMNGSGKEAVKL